MRLRLCIDPGPAQPRHDDLFAAGLEYSVAVAGLGRDTDPLRQLPDALWLELYAYEFVERVREAGVEVNASARAGPRNLKIPFWPGAVFAAADVGPNCWAELEAMLPEFGAIEVITPGSSAVAEAAIRVMGEQRFCYLRYAESLRQWAAARGIVIRDR